MQVKEVMSGVKLLAMEDLTVLFATLTSMTAQRHANREKLSVVHAGQVLPSVSTAHATPMPVGVQ